MSVEKLKDLEKVYDEFLLLGDRTLVKLLCGMVIANQLDHVDPVWILLVAAPSSGKSEVIQAFNDIMDPKSKKPMLYPISDLTINSFASGQNRVGEETSLLFKMPRGGILAFKDFTSLISKNQEARAEIMGQLREIYDGAYIKRTGNGKDVAWKGKVGALAGCTEVIYEHLEELSAMGDRFAMYSMLQPDRKEALRFAMRLKRAGESKDVSRAKVRAATKSYIEYALKRAQDVTLSINNEAEEELITVADFCTKVRSGVIVDKKYNRVEFVPSKEMPMRLMEQLLALMTAFIVMRKVEIPADEPKPTVYVGDIPDKDDAFICYKIAFDSIPIKRRMALKLIAKYTHGARTAGLATAIGYETKVVAGWLSQLNGLGIVSREKMGGPQGDRWKLIKEYEDIMVKFQGVKIEDKELVDEAIIHDEEKEWETAYSTAGTDMKDANDNW